PLGWGPFAAPAPYTARVPNDAWRPGPGAPMNDASRGLIGRDAEIDQADAALAEAASGTPQVLLVGGDAGIGKTTLVSSIADPARDHGFDVLVGHGLDIDDGTRMRPVREALRRAGNDLVESW